MKRLVYIPLFFVLFFCIQGLSLAGENDQQQAAEKILSLAECVSIALDKSPQILYSQSDVLEKEFSLESSKKELYPSLYFQYGYQHSPDTSPLIVIENYYNYSFSIEQPIYRGRSLVTGVELGELDLELSKAVMTQTQNDIILAVHEAYYNLLKTRKFEYVAEQSLKERKAHLKDAKAFFKAGLIPKNDMLQSEVQLANTEIELIRAKNLSSLAQAQLNTLLRRPMDEKTQLEDILQYEPSDVSWDQAVEQAQKHRPELRQSDIAIQQADKNIILSKAPYLPSVSVSLNYLKQGDDLIADDYPIGSSEVKTAMATLEWRFWAWGQKKDEAAIAKYNLKKAKESQADLLDRIILQVREAYLDIKESEYNISVTEKAIEQAEEDFRINQSRYRAQLSTTTDVLGAQTRLSRAKINYFNALYNYRIALMKLAWATGTLVL
ncbi:MAG: TolC family protein [Deltaproteobacteria bacterium]|jgi:outer membrane protein TolC|nr:TolC family protein [Deltaproteobacteria bacterium]